MDQESYAAAVHKTYESCIEELERNKAQFIKNPEKDFTREKNFVLLLRAFLCGGRMWGASK